MNGSLPEIGERFAVYNQTTREGFLGTVVETQPATGGYTLFIDKEDSIPFISEEE